MFRNTKRKRIQRLESYNSTLNAALNEERWFRKRQENHDKEKQLIVALETLLVHLGKNGYEGWVFTNPQVAVAQMLQAVKPYQRVREVPRENPTTVKITAIRDHDEVIGDF